MRLLGHEILTVIAQCVRHARIAKHLLSRMRSSPVSVSGSSVVVF